MKLNKQDPRAQLMAGNVVIGNSLNNEYQSNKIKKNEKMRSSEGAINI